MEGHDPSKLLVMRKRCNECLFTQNRLVSEERAAQYVEEIDKNDSYFVCHKSTYSGSRGVMCRGDWDRDSNRTLVMRLAKWLGVVEFIDEKDL